MIFIIKELYSVHKSKWILIELRVLFVKENNILTPVIVSYKTNKCFKKHLKRLASFIAWGELAGVYQIWRILAVSVAVFGKVWVLRSCCRVHLGWYRIRPASGGEGSSGGLFWLAMRAVCLLLHVVSWCSPCFAVLRKGVVRFIELS